MTTFSTQHEWAIEAATSRAARLGDPISIYAHGDERIIKTWCAAPPPSAFWKLIATIQPDGSYSFGPIQGENR